MNLADLFRIKGVGEEYSDSVEDTGVDTVVELAQRNPQNLHKKLGEVNEAQKLVRKLPSESQVISWIRQAKGLPRKIKYDYQTRLDGSQIIQSIYQYIDISSSTLSEDR